MTHNGTGRLAYPPTTGEMAEDLLRHLAPDDPAHAGQTVTTCPLPSTE